ncbi:hypothetical protein EV182_001984 [Spiromyces aspiralis]|uniref:Uncharacterized protein n=1 Tax=Spiromyces aspiralis TaxID=68401 RepID=A0ACC1HHF2_9FUNG|nr:hypothetical protein EV182_001984 [Spiromyces aspiralis]
MSLPDTSLDSGPERKRRRCTASSTTGSNGASARVTGDVVSVGTNNWITFVRDNKLLVDKTKLLLHVMDDYGSDVIFRPPRFGKTMFLSMAHDFLNVARTDEELAERKRIFKGMSVHSADPTFVDKHCGKYPVIYINLKVAAIIDAWEHAISDTSNTRLNRIRDRINRKIDNMRNSIFDSVTIPTELVAYLSRYYNAKCIVLVDEFDVPVTSAPEGIREEVKDYMLDLLSPLGKDNKKVRRFIMVGIDPVSFNTFGSGLNNCIWYPLHKDSDCSREGASSYQFAFGFTEEEVGALVDRVADKMGLVEGQADRLRRVARKWYGGYHACRGVRLYNPWSVMSYIEDITKSREACLEAAESGRASRYWLATDDKAALARAFDMADGTRFLLPVIQDLVADFLNLVDATDGPAPNYDPRVRFRTERYMSDIEDPDNTMERMPWCVTTSDGVDQWAISIADSVQGAPATGILGANGFMTTLYYRGCLSVKDEAYLTIPNYEVLCAWLDLVGMDRLADRLVSGVGGRPVLVDRLLSGEYPEFIEHVEHALEAQGQEITAETHETFYRGLLSLMLSLFLDSAKYDVIREPRLRAADDGSGRKCAGVLIEVKRADPDTVDGDARSLTADDVMFIEDRSKDRRERACKKLGDKTFRSLAGLLAEGYDQVLENKYLSTFNGCCDEVLVVVASFSGGRCLFQFEYFKYRAEDWSLDPERHPVVDDLACPYNWPGL